MPTDNPATAPRPAGRDLSQLDWPFHAGLVDQVLEKVARKVQRRRARRQRLASGAAAVAALAFAFLWGLPTLRDTATVTTQAANRQTLVLADGSQTELNARTSLRTDFRYGRRVVHLERGEAFFAVAKDAAHPFLVETPAGTVRVTGTEFNVRLGDDRRLEVTLLEGSVHLERDHQEVAVLAPGEQWSPTDAGGSPRRLSAAALENVTAWRQGRLVLDGLTLAEAIGRLAAYHGKTLTVAAEVAQLRPGGSVPIDNLAGALDALQDTLPIRVSSTDGGAFRLLPR